MAGTIAVVCPACGSGFVARVPTVPPAEVAVERERLAAVLTAMASDDKAACTAIVAGGRTISQTFTERVAALEAAAAILRGG